MIHLFNIRQLNVRKHREPAHRYQHQHARKESKTVQIQVHSASAKPSQLLKTSDETTRPL